MRFIAYVGFNYVIFCFTGSYVNMHLRKKKQYVKEKILPTKINLKYDEEYKTMKENEGRERLFASLHLLCI